MSWSFLKPSNGYIDAYFTKFSVFALVEIFFHNLKCLNSEISHLRVLYVKIAFNSKLNCRVEIIKSENVPEVSKRGLDLR